MKTMQLYLPVRPSVRLSAVIIILAPWQAMHEVNVRILPFVAPMHTARLSLKSS